MLLFIDTDPSDLIVVASNDFEGGLFVNGSLAQLGLNNFQATLVPESAGIVNFVGQWFSFPVQNFTFQRTIFLVEANDPSVISDIFTYDVNVTNVVNTRSFVGTIVGAFTSDFENNFGPLPLGVNPDDVFVENGQPVLVGLTNAIGIPNLTIGILSDVEVPEPGTLALLGLGLPALGRRFVSKKRQ